MKYVTIQYQIGISVPSHECGLRTVVFDVHSFIYTMYQVVKGQVISHVIQITVTLFHRENDSDKKYTRPKIPDPVMISNLISYTKQTLGIPDRYSLSI